MGKTQWDAAYDTSPDSIPVKRKPRKPRSKPAAPVHDDFFFDTSTSHGIKRISDNNGVESWDAVTQKDSPFKSRNWRTFRNASGAFDGETTDDDIVVRNVSNLSATSSLSWAEDAVETEFTEKIFGMWDEVQKVCIGEVAERPGDMPEHIFEECLAWKRAFPNQDLSRFSRPSDNDANLTPTEARFKATQISCPSSPVYKSTTPMESPNNLVPLQNFKIKQRESPSYVSMWLSDCDTQHGRKYISSNGKAVEDLGPNLPQDNETMSESTFGTGGFGDVHLERRAMFHGQDSLETDIPYAQELGITAGVDRGHGDNTSSCIVTSSDDPYRGQSKAYPVRPHAPFADSHANGGNVGQSRRSSKTFTISSEDTLAPPAQSRHYSNNNYLDQSSSALSSFQKADRTFDDGFHRYFSTPKVMGKDRLGTGQSLGMPTTIDEDPHLYRFKAYNHDGLLKSEKRKTDVLDTSFETVNHQQSAPKFQRDVSAISRTTARYGASERKHGMSKMPPYPVPVVSVTANTTSSSGTNHRGNMHSSHSVVSKNRHWSRHSSTTTVSSTNSSTLMGPMHNHFESGSIPPISNRLSNFKMEHHQNPFYETQASCHQSKAGSGGHRHHDFCHFHQDHHMNPSLLPPITTRRNKRPDNLQMPLNSTQDIKKGKSNRPFLYWLLDKVSPS